MKITSQTPSALLPPAPAGRPAAAAANTAGAPVQAVPEGMRLSATACALGRTAARSEGDFDARRVAAVRQAIAEGSFRVNAQTIADKLLGNAAEFLTHR